MPLNVEITPVPFERKQELDWLMQEYLAENAEHSGDEPGNDGRFEDQYFDLYWVEDSRHPFFIIYQNEVVGFVLVRQMTERAGRDIHSVAEFYVRRTHRRRGVGRRAAELVFERFPGWWHVAQEAVNLDAQAFWRQVIGAYTRGDFEEVDYPGWDGPAQEFYKE